MDKASFVISLIALCVTGLSAYLQYIHVRGPRIRLLDINDTEAQKSSVLLYENLPPLISHDYPNFHDKRRHHAIVRVPLANEGDRSGYSKLLSVQVEGPVEGIAVEERVRPSFYIFVVLPAFSIGLHTILLRNLPPIEAELPITLLLTIEVGGIKPRFKRKSPTETFHDLRLKVCLVPQPRELMAHNAQTTFPSGVLGAVDPAFTGQR